MIMQTHTEAPTAVPTRRAHSLDALRGYAIMTMILAATEAFGILPAWMYHAQEPPPTHVFNPHIYGITWVDLIFPFFLFSMGAAIPLSLGSCIFIIFTYLMLWISHSRNLNFIIIRLRLKFKSALCFLF